MPSLNPLAEAILFGNVKTQEDFMRVATLKPGKTWEDVKKVWANAGSGTSFEQLVAVRARALATVVESTSLYDDGF